MEVSKLSFLRKKPLFVGLMTRTGPKSRSLLTAYRSAKGVISTCVYTFYFESR